jgi:hypothetical protein
MTPAEVNNRRNDKVLVGAVGKERDKTVAQLIKSIQEQTGVPFCKQVFLFANFIINLTYRKGPGCWDCQLLICIFQSLKGGLTNLKVQLRYCMKEDG